MPLMMLGPQEMMVIAALVILVFGARKLPQLGAGLGQGIRNFKESLAGKDEGQIEEGQNSEKPSA